MIKNEKMADIALIVTAIIWGTGFIGTEYAIEAGASASLIISMRFLLAGLILGGINFYELKNIDKKTLQVGIIAGTILAFSFYLQTAGQSLTSVSNSSFLTSTNVVIVPFIVWFFTKQRPKTKYFVLGTTAFLGAAVLSVDFSEGIHLNTGDILVFIATCGFACHIAFLGIFGKDKNSNQLTFLQMSVAGIVAFMFMLIFDRGAMDMEIAKKAFPPIAYLAVFSSCICYYLQTTAQQHTAPSKTAIFLCTEGLFGSIFAVILGLDSLTTKLVLGGFIIISSVILAEVDFEHLFRRKGKT